MAVGRLPKRPNFHVVRGSSIRSSALETYRIQGIVHSGLIWHAPPTEVLRSDWLPPPKALMPKTVLIADDGAEMRKLTRKVIEMIPGFTVCGEAVDGLEAIAKVRELAPDLVILDLAMPRMNGLDVAQVLRSTGSRMPIILFTLHTNVISTLQASVAGIDAIVPKIGDLEGLVSQVERLAGIRLPTFHS